MDIESIRAGLRERTAKTPERPSAKQLVEALAVDIKNMLKCGYRLRDVADYLHETAAVTIKESTLQSYLSRAMKKTATPTQTRETPVSRPHGRSTGGRHAAPAAPAKKTADNRSRIDDDIPDKTESAAIDIPRGDF